MVDINPEPYPFDLPFWTETKECEHAGINKDTFG